MNRYTAKVVSISWGRAGTGNEQVGLMFETKPPDVLLLPYYGSFHSDKGLAITIRTLRACGWTGDDLTKMTINDLCRDVSIVVEREGPDDEPTITQVWPGNTVPMKTHLRDEEITTLALKVQAAIRAGAKQP